jgi:hypothetical protein
MEQLDSDILTWIAERTGSPELAAQIAAADVRKRDYMRTGFFVYLDTDRELAPVPAGVRPVSPRIDGPGLMDGAGCTLFIRDGYLHYLEIYARGGFFPAEGDDWQLGEES